MSRCPVTCSQRAERAETMRRWKVQSALCWRVCGGSRLAQRDQELKTRLCACSHFRGGLQHVQRKQRRILPPQMFSAVFGTCHISACCVSIGSLHVFFGLFVLFFVPECSSRRACQLVMQNTPSPIRSISLLKQWRYFIIFTFMVKPPKMWFPFQCFCMERLGKNELGTHKDSLKK